MNLRDAPERPLVMGILNVTPDSFSDGGAWNGPRLPARIDAMVQEGIDILDVGGESTRPGHRAVLAEEELERVLPALEHAAAAHPDLRVSIDTRKADVARAALHRGAHIVNDVSGLDDRAMAGVIAATGADAVLMRHRSIEGPLLAGCRTQLEEIVARAEAAGIPRDRIVVDPGLGFGDPPGSDAEANLALIDGVASYSLGLPVLVGASRKRFIGTLSGEPEAARRVGGSVAVALRAVEAGAAIVRVHDVRETVQALRTWRFSRPRRD